MKIWQEDSEPTPSIIFSASAQTGFTDITSIANYFVFGHLFGLTSQNILTYSLAEVVDWATHAQADKDKILAFIETNQFTASIPEAVRADITAPYKGFKIFNTTSAKSEWWNGTAWNTTGASSSDNEYILDFAYNAIQATTSASFLRIPLQVLIPILSEFPGATKIEAKLSISYGTESSSTGEVRMYDYTDLIEIVGSEEGCPNIVGWGNKTGSFRDITSVAGKALSLQIRRETGSGQNDFLVEAANIRLKIT